MPCARLTAPLVDLVANYLPVRALAALLTVNSPLLKAVKQAPFGLARTWWVVAVSRSVAWRRALSIAAFSADESYSRNRCSAIIPN
jgi:hypothetical protein